MNIFVVPSWYPSNDFPTCGQFALDQVEGLGEIYPSFTFCISLWGQQEESNLLWLREPIRNFKKILRHHQNKPSIKNISSNIIEIYTPALTWTRKILSGNIRGIATANLNNLELFQQKAGKIDIIHAHVAFPAGYVAMLLSEKLNIPFIITEHLDPFPTKLFTNRGGGLSTYIEKPLQKTSMVVVENENLFKKIKDCGINNITCISNMVNEKLFIPASHTNNTKNFKFLFIGDMIDRKGIKYLIEAISLLKTPSITFTLCGTGEMLEAYKSYSKYLGTSNVVTWYGYLTRQEIILKMQECDAFILPSLSENLGMVLLEAIACGKPIIATKCGGPEAIVNDKNGVLAKVGDSRDLADKIIWMVKNFGSFDANTIRQNFLERFSRPVVSAQIVELYKKIIDTHN